MRILCCFSFLIFVSICGMDTDKVNIGRCVFNINSTNSNLVLTDVCSRNILASMLGEIANTIDVHEIAPQLHIDVIEHATWKNLLGTFRYLGGTPGTADIDGLPHSPEIRSFIVSPSNGQGVYSSQAYDLAGENGNASCPNARLVDFIPNASKALEQLGSHVQDKTEVNASLKGIREIRDYIARRQPILALIFQNIASVNMGHYDVSSENNIYDYVSWMLSEFLGAHMSGGEYVYVDLANVGVPENVLPGSNYNEQTRIAGEAIYSLYHPIEIL